MKVVRDSKFRHVFAEASKEDYKDVRPSGKATESTGFRCNDKFMAVGWESGGGGALAVINQGSFGRIPRDVPLVTGHKGPITDFDFNPFDDNMLVSASEDLTLKVWQIPDGGLKEHLREPLLTLEGHGKKVMFNTFNRSAGHIIASCAFDMKTKVWNIADQAEAFSIDIPDQAWCLKWNYNGSLLAQTYKDKMLRVIDPRASTFAAETKAHEGSKATKLEWVGSPSDADECHKIITTGFSSQAERQIAIWDLRKFSSSEPAEPLNLLVLDTGTGALFPFYDPGTGMAYFCGKGDANVRYFEMVKEDPYIHFISNFESRNPQKGFDFMPKRSVDTTKHEVMKYLKLEANAIVPVSFKVPRKSEAFQEDLFPDCPSQEPAMSPDDWVGGSECKNPKMQSMEPGAAGAASPKKAAGGGIAIVSVKDLKKQLADAQERIKELEAENASLKEQLAAK